MKNLPNKVDMTLVPKGPADLALETMTPEGLDFQISHFLKTWNFEKIQNTEKQGYSNRHDFSLSSDKYYLEKLQRSKNEEIDQLNRGKMVPGTPITAPSKPANQSQYPNLN